ncbi:unnamed protein product [Onchocerca flexuosa]|uniref:Myosin motor domain-containing protein n=1 Tax=Onchocerca flexuosa TaxID=387005 RepID=A0A183HF36_9BILA|nr:unnamed protein product [Onchocerca flexuosa]
MSFDSGSSLSSFNTINVFPHRSLTATSTASSTDETHLQTISIYLFSFNPVSNDDQVNFDSHKWATSEELIEKILQQKQELANTSAADYDLYEIMGTMDGQTFKERKLDRNEYPLAVQMLWPRLVHSENIETTPKNRLVLSPEDFSVYFATSRHKNSGQSSSGMHFASTSTSSTIDSFLAKFLAQPPDREYPDLCMLPELTEQTLLDNLKNRFINGQIYTYIGKFFVISISFQKYLK